MKVAVTSGRPSSPQWPLPTSREDIGWEECLHQCLLHLHAQTLCQVGENSVRSGGCVWYHTNLSSNPAWALARREGYCR